jgi:hexosaminidase
MFLEKELEIINESNKTTMIWEGKDIYFRATILINIALIKKKKKIDPVTSNLISLPKDVVLQVWTNPIKDAISMGHRVIASNYNFWYLDCGHGGWE